MLLFPSPCPSLALPQSADPHAQASSTWTYDSKLVSLEMHRLGNLAHLPSLAPSLSAAQSSLALTMAPAGAPSIAPSESPWTFLHVLVLPLFNSEPLRCPM